MSPLKKLLVICTCIATTYIYIYRVNFVLIKHKIYVFYRLDGCECGANNQGSNTHLYIISSYFLHKLSYYSSREEIIGVHVDSKQMLGFFEKYLRGKTVETGALI
jgi:hypothetical protein